MFTSKPFLDLDSLSIFDISVENERKANESYIIIFNKIKHFLLTITSKDIAGYMHETKK
jgi:hypothetical protein